MVGVPVASTGVSQSDVAKCWRAILKTATLLASPVVELVLRESPDGEHATNGVAESAVREVKRQTRPLKFALEAHVGRIVEPHSILRWIPTMASEAISFFRIQGDGLTFWTCLEETRSKFGESVHCRPAVPRAVESGMQPKLYVGLYLGHHARSASIGSKKE